jgi:membrane-associated protease RseP (regulator of RpoE activity)
MADDPADRATPRPDAPARATPLEQWGYGLFLVVLLGLFAAEVFTDYQPVKLSAFLFVVFWAPLLVLHEAGHAVVARLLGWRVGRIVIGMGKPVSRFALGRTRGEIRLAPVEGFVTPVPRNLRGVRVKSALIYFAGPGSELLVLLVVVLLVGPATLLTRTDHIGVIACQSLCLAILVSVIINLVPHSAETQGGLAANDGLGIIRSFLLPEAYYRALLHSQPE